MEPDANTTSERGQTEPIAALVAVATVCLALALYASALYGMFPTSTDRSVAEPTLESVQGTVAADGVYDPHATPDPITEIPSDRLPDGNTVTITVTTIERGQPVAVSTGRYVHGEYEPRTPPDHPASDPPRPADNSVDEASRPIAVRESTGKVSSGTLHVEVWS
ncbi:DUF7285 family protein [Natronosalvus vescus]|uniref:DUF7285 family protein n=1 Tax=Natronosalvus vescus TaxID=2953881 RepID=UPI002090A01E|nr:hypothetical protein [Natronosalvus vescus]